MKNELQSHHCIFRQDVKPALVMLWWKGVVRSSGFYSSKNMRMCQNFVIHIYNGVCLKARDYTMKPCFFNVLHSANYWDEHRSALAWRPGSCMCSFRSEHKDPSHQHMPGNMEIYLGQLLVCFRRGRTFSIYLHWLWFDLVVFCHQSRVSCLLLSLLPDWSVCSHLSLLTCACLLRVEPNEINKLSSNSLLTYNNNNINTLDVMSSNVHHIALTVYHMHNSSAAITRHEHNTAKLRWRWATMKCPGWRIRSG